MGPQTNPPLVFFTTPLPQTTQSTTTTTTSTTPQPQTTQKPYIPPAPTPFHNPAGNLQPVPPRENDQSLSKGYIGVAMCIDRRDCILEQKVVKVQLHGNCQTSYFSITYDDGRSDILQLHTIKCERNHIQA